MSKILISLGDEQLSFDDAADVEYTSEDGTIILTFSRKEKGHTIIVPNTSIVQIEDEDEN